MSKITLNIVEPGSPTPVDPGIDPAVPNTGLFTNGIGGPEATIILSVVLILAIASIALATYMYRKHKKAGKATKLVHIVEQTKTIIKSKKRTTAGLAAISLLVSACTFTAFMLNTNKSNTNAIEGEDGLTVDVSDADFTIELGDEPVFAALPVEVSVEEATQAGYTLTAYADNTDIVSTTNPNNIIPMVTVNSEEDLVSLTDNTYGISLSEPTSKDDKVYTTLSTNQNTPTTLKTIDDYSPTEAEDKTTIYYGFYITPDIPKGTYEGSSIYFEAEPNYITNLSFNGNDNDGGEEIEDITIPAGNTIILPANTYTKDGYHFTGWNTQVDGEGEPYAARAEFTATQGETKDITLYAQWEEDMLYMQDVATWKNTLTTDETVIAVDNRDGKEYTVAKLRDGKVWMTRNLDLQKEDLKAGVTLDSTNTDHPVTDFVLPDSQKSGSDSWGSYDDQASIDTAHVYDLNDNGETYHYCIEYGQWGQCAAYSEEAIPSEDLGNHYNWYSATAGTGTYSLGDGEVATGSICPAGWRLPNSSRGGIAMDYSTLLYTYGIISSAAKPYDVDSDKISSIYDPPLSMVRTGSYSRGTYKVGVSGGLWSSTAANGNNNVLNFDFSNTEFFPWYDFTKYEGASIRCLAE